MITIDQIDATSSVNDIVRRYPAALRLLTSHGIDVCCEGDLPLSIAAGDAGVDLSVLVREIADAVTNETGNAR